jgi:hypothetical protein
LSSAYSNSKCYLIRLRITLRRSIRQQEDIPKCAATLVAKAVVYSQAYE